jgi:serine/threonine protein kinase
MTKKTDYWSLGIIILEIIEFPKPYRGLVDDDDICIQMQQVVDIYENTIDGRIKHLADQKYVSLLNGLLQFKESERCDAIVLKSFLDEIQPQKRVKRN